MSSIIEVHAQPGSTRTVEGDWDDIDAAIGVASGKAILYGIDGDAPDDATRVYTFVGRLDEPITIKAARLPPDPSSPNSAPAIPGAPSRIQLTTTVGRFGRPDRETAILDAIEQRLTELKGVDVAPAR